MGDGPLLYTLESHILNGNEKHTVPSELTINLTNKPERNVFFHSLEERRPGLMLNQEAQDI